MAMFCILFFQLIVKHSYILPSVQMDPLLFKLLHIIT